MVKLRNIAVRIALTALIALSCTAVARGATPPDPAGSEAIIAFPTVLEADPVVSWMVDEVDEATLSGYLGDLTGEWPVTIDGAPVTIRSRNSTSSTSQLQAATNYVGDHLEALGLAVEYHAWQSDRAPNVIGEKAGLTSPDDIFMIMAHLDDMPTGTLAPGADDNASGSVAVLVAADVLSQFSWDCTLRFALWTGEEEGLRGSDSYAARARAAGENIVGIVNLDMIGWNTPGSPPDIDLHAYDKLPDTVNLAHQMASVIDVYDLNLIPEVSATGDGSSDHASFWDRGYTAIFGMEDYEPYGHDFNPYYHTTGDTRSMFDMAYYTEFVKAAVGEMAHMAGCLTTGTIEGAPIASHDLSFVDATIDLWDGNGREYILQSVEGQGYCQAVPAGNYQVRATAYGYEDVTASGIAVAAGAVVTEDFVLTAIAPAAPVPIIYPENGEATLSWAHLAPNTAYQVHRSTNPYFAFGPSTLLASLDASHAPIPGEVLAYSDTWSEYGDFAVNHFYVVGGVNAAGEAAIFHRVGEFDFALMR